MQFFDRSIQVDRKNYLLLIALIFVLLAAGGALAFDIDNGDLQWWTTTGISFDLNKDWTVSAEEEFRLADGAERLVYHHTDLGFTYKGFADWLDVGLNFRKAYFEDSSDSWREENRPHINLTLKTKLFDLYLSNRARVEYRDREAREDIWVYRNKTSVKFPLKVSEWEFQPYLADEIFIKFGEDNISVNRLYSGFSFKISENLKGSIFYMWQNTKISGGRLDSNIIGTSLKLYF